MTRYRVLVGMNYPGPGGVGRRAEIGDVVTDLPAAAIPGLLAQRAIEPEEEEGGTLPSAEETGPVNGPEQEE